jgi:hypothetical protein
MAPANPHKDKTRSSTADHTFLRTGFKIQITPDLKTDLKTGNFRFRHFQNHYAQNGAQLK